MSWPHSDRMINDAVSRLASRGLIESASDVGGGGLAVAVAKAAFEHGIGANVSGRWHPHLSSERGNKLLDPLIFFQENPAVLLSCDVANKVQVMGEFTSNMQIRVLDLGLTTAGTIRLQTPSWSSDLLSVSELKEIYSRSLASHLAEEVMA